MTYPINNQNLQIPAYSGVTINITNPTLNAGQANNPCHQIGNIQPMNPHNCGNMSCPMNNNSQGYYTQYNDQPIYEQQAPLPQPYYQDMIPVQQTQAEPKVLPQQTTRISPQETFVPATNVQPEGLYQQPTQSQAKEEPINNYPPQYYMNNYNYNIQPERMGSSNIRQQEADNKDYENQTLIQEKSEPEQTKLQTKQYLEEPEEDMTSSTQIINDLDSRLEAQKDLEKNGKQTRVIALTNEYIMSLENYLNNPNTEIRLMAAKEILTRLDEDKTRYDDAALNALLNKMLQDPDKLVRIAALSAFSSQLASGNDYTVKLLTDIQSNPDSDKEDVVEAANILLKMSAATKIKYTPTEEKNIAEEAKAE